MTDEEHDEREPSPRYCRECGCTLTGKRPDMTIRQRLEAIRERSAASGQTLNYEDAVAALDDLDNADYWNVGWPEGNTGGGRFIPDPVAAATPLDPEIP